VASVVGGSATPDADATTKGKIQLANDLGGKYIDMFSKYKYLEIIYLLFNLYYN
jgi:hypothetical protein